MGISLLGDAAFRGADGTHLPGLKAANRLRRLRLQGTSRNHKAPLSILPALSTDRNTPGVFANATFARGSYRRTRFLELDPGPAVAIVRCHNVEQHKLSW